MSTDSRAPELTRAGLVVAGTTVPLFTGSVHFFGLDPAAWPTVLATVRGMGVRVVETCVPWALYERAPSAIDFDALEEPRLDLTRFLELVGEAGLYASVRIGPAHGAALTRFGIPEHVVWDPECQARSAAGSPVVVPAVPLAFPAPSLCSDKYLAEARRWARAVGERIAPLCHPHGPVVACHVDPGTDLFAVDRHPNALERYRRLLEEKGRSAEAIERALELVTASSERAGTDAEEWTWLCDWAELGERLERDAVRTLSEALESTGISVPIFRRRAPVTPTLGASRHGASVLDLSALAPMSAASDRLSTAIATSEHAARAAAHGVPAVARVAAGFSPFSRPQSDAECLNAALFALAHGIRGLELHQAVESERWIGAPCDRRGAARPFAEAWTRLARALEETRFAELERVVAVRIVRARALAQSLAVRRAQLPIAAALEALVIGRRLEPNASSVLDPILDAERLVFRLAAELDCRHVPYAVIDDDLAPVRAEQTRLTIVVGPVDPSLEALLRREVDGGHAVVLAPFADLPSFDPRIPLLPRDETLLGGALDDAIRTLGLRRFEATPGELGVAVHTDASGRARVLFAVNTTDRPLAGHVEAFGANVAEDVLDGSTFEARGGTLSLPVPPKAVRFLHLKS
ncbi:MAG: beta-galactosidase [Pseudomonadota bacterium]|nr:MAG: hypothetical protein DIU78_15045 [Pseudomonadota bacterium]